MTAKLKVQAVPMSSPPSQGLAAAGASSVPTALRDGEVAYVQYGGVRIRHQAPGPFSLDWKGEQPLLLYRFSGRRAADAQTPPEAFVLLPPGLSADCDEAGPMEVLAVAYDRLPHPLREAVQGLGEAEPQEQADPGLRALAHEMRRVVLGERLDHGDYLTGLARTMLLRALQVAGEPSPRPRSAPLPPARLRRVVQAIEDHLPEPLAVAELADIAGLSRTHFTRAFESATGQTPHRFILSRRLARAREMLQATDLDLASIAVRLGFSSHSHLATAFRRAFGTTPSAYRRARREAADTSQRWIGSVV